MAEEEKVHESPNWQEVFGGEARWEDWRWQMANRLTSLAQLHERWPAFVPTPGQLRVERRFPFALTPYYLSLIQKPDFTDPIFRMAVPHAHEEKEVDALFRDPLGEEAHTPVAGLVHRYPDRAVLLLNGLCPTYCRHCTRKRFVGLEVGAASTKQIEGWASYLRATPSIKDVILSGGDPLTLSDARLERVLTAISAVPSVEMIRIGTRIPVLMPMRITDALCAMLERYHPLWVVTHFNHPQELTPLAARACERLLRAGIPVNNQAVLLRGINDNPDTIEALCRGLMKMRVRPYYLHQSDLVHGIEHLRTPISRGIQIMEALRGRLGGLAIPLYVLDLPQGGGKIPILPNYVVSRSPEYTILRNFEGRIVSYPEPKLPPEPTPSPQPRGAIADQLAGLRQQPILPNDLHTNKPT